jgi:MoaA/NifB/PqqE/SkfB family radical SAM enzyme
MINEINIQGFKIRIDDLKKEKLMPEYFNTPLVGVWEITRECNLRCVFCYNNSGKKLPNELTHDQKINVAKQIVDAKIYRMCISGGEPILSPSFWDIAKIFKDGKILCNTITNGSYVNEENISSYTKYFSNIQVSLDGSSQKTHDTLRGKKGSWEKAVEACKLIRNNKGYFSIATVVTPINLNEIEQIIDLAYNLGASLVRIDEARFIGRAATKTGVLKLSRKQVDKLTKIVKEKKNEYEGKMNIDILPKIQYSYVRGFAKIPPEAIYISPVGVCSIDPILPFSGGSLKEKSLKEIWNELKTSHKNRDFINYSLKVKTGRDFEKLNKIPYVNGELHD